MGLSWLFRRIFILFCVTPDAYYPAFFLCMPVRGSADLKMASGKPLVVVNVFFEFFNLDYFLDSA